MRELASEQIGFIRIFSKIPYVLQGLALDLLECYKSYSELSFRYRTNPTSMSHITSIDAQLRDIEIQTFEKIHGTIELFGDDFNECKTIDLLESIVNDDVKILSGDGFPMHSILPSQCDESQIRRLDERKTDRILGG